MAQLTSIVHRMATWRGIAMTGVLVVVLFILYSKVEPPTIADINVVTPPSIIASLPHWVAEEEGFYEEEGLVVHAIGVNGSPMMMQALVDQDADVLPAVSLVDVIANQNKKALDRPVVFSHSRFKRLTPFDSIVVPTGGDLQKLVSLEGRRVAVYPGSTAEAALKVYLQRNGVDADKVDCVALPPTEHLPALERGDVDAAYVYEPLRTQALEGKMCRELSKSVYGALNEPSAMGVACMSARILEKQPRKAKKYLAAWDRAIDFIRANPVAARQIMARRLGLAETIASNATWVDATKVDELDLSAIKATEETIKAMGLLRGSDVLDPKLFTLPQ